MTSSARPNPRHITRIIAAIVAGIITTGGLLTLASCTGATDQAHAESTESAPSPEEVQIDFASNMRTMHEWTTKLGHAIHAHNHLLADHYADRIAQQAQLIMDDHPTYDGADIAMLLPETIRPQLNFMRKDLDGETPNWSAIQTHYATLIKNCNLCHAATFRQFIVITPPQGDGTAIFSQQFTTGQTAGPAASTSPASQPESTSQPTG